MNDVTKSSGTAVSSGAAAQPATKESVQPMANLRNEIDRFFEGFDQGWPFGSGRRWFDWPSPAPRGGTPVARPATDISEHDDAYEISLELPGMEEKDIQVKLERGVLTVTGEKREETSEKKKDYHLTERRFGSFQRSFALPDTVESGKIEASFKQGVLTVTLPKQPAAKPAAQRIEVKSG